MKYIVLTLLFYFVYKYGKYVFGNLGKPNHASENNSKNQSRPNVKSKPQETNKFEEGEYIDFEEMDD